MEKPNQVQKAKYRIVAAFAVAVLMDAIELPLNLLFLSAWLAVPAEFAVVILDLITMGLLLWLLGFHWPLIAALGVEVIPGAEVLPTWTGCVSYVVWQRKQSAKKTEPSKHAASEIIIDIPSK